MTPERKAWWDSLPAEEKQVRRSIKLHKEFIKDDKEILNTKIFCNAKDCKSRIHEAKIVIKALRKQIGMCPIDRVSRYDPTGSCPTCNDLVIRREHDCCASCGQKLRWQ